MSLTSERNCFCCGQFDGCVRISREKRSSVGRVRDKVSEATETKKIARGQPPTNWHNRYTANELAKTTFTFTFTSAETSTATATSTAKQLTIGQISGGAGSGSSSHIHSGAGRGTKENDEIVGCLSSSLGEFDSSSGPATCLRRCNLGPGGQSLARSDCAPDERLARTGIQERRRGGDVGEAEDKHEEIRKGIDFIAAKSQLATTTAHWPPSSIELDNKQVDRWRRSKGMRAHQLAGCSQAPVGSNHIVASRWPFSKSREDFLVLHQHLQTTTESDRGQLLAPRSVADTRQEESYRDNTATTKVVGRARQRLNSCCCCCCETIRESGRKLSNHKSAEITDVRCCDEWRAFIYVQVGETEATSRKIIQEAPFRRQRRGRQRGRRRKERRKRRKRKLEASKAERSQKMVKPRAVDSRPSVRSNARRKRERRPRVKFKRRRLADDKVLNRELYCDHDKLPQKIKFVHHLPGRPLKTAQLLLVLATCLLELSSLVTSQILTVNRQASQLSISNSTQAPPNVTDPTKPFDPLPVGLQQVASDGYRWPFIGLVAFMFIGATGNILVCMAVWRERRLQTATNYFLLSLAVADLLVCTLVMPFGIIYEFYGRWPFDWRICNLWATCDVLTCSSSILHMCFISVGRYLGIRNPLHARQANLFVSRRAVLWRIAIAWLSSALIASPLTMMSLYDHRNIVPSPGECAITNKYFLIFGSMLAFFIPMFVMVPSYVMTVRLLSRRAEFVRNNSLLLTSAPALATTTTATAPQTATTTSANNHKRSAGGLSDQIGLWASGAKQRLSQQSKQRSLDSCQNAGTMASSPPNTNHSKPPLSVINSSSDINHDRDADTTDTNCAKREEQDNLSIGNSPATNAMDALDLPSKEVPPEYGKDLSRQLCKFDRHAYLNTSPEELRFTADYTVEGLIRPLCDGQARAQPQCLNKVTRYIDDDDDDDDGADASGDNLDDADLQVVAKPGLPEAKCGNTKINENRYNSSKCISVLSADKTIDRVNQAGDRRHTLEADSSVSKSTSCGRCSSGHIQVMKCKRGRKSNNDNSNNNDNNNNPNASKLANISENDASEQQQTQRNCCCRCSCSCYCYYTCKQLKLAARPISRAEITDTSPDRCHSRNGSKCAIERKQITTTPASASASTELVASNRRGPMHSGCGEKHPPTSCSSCNRRRREKSEPPEDTLQYQRRCGFNGGGKTNGPLKADAGIGMGPQTGSEAGKVESGQLLASCISSSNEQTSPVQLNSSSGAAKKATDREENDELRFELPFTDGDDLVASDCRDKGQQTAASGRLSLQPISIVVVRPSRGIASIQTDGQTNKGQAEVGGKQDFCRNEHEHEQEHERHRHQHRHHRHKHHKHHHHKHHHNQKQTTDDDQCRHGHRHHRKRCKKGLQSEQNSTEPTSTHDNSLANETLSQPVINKHADRCVACLQQHRRSRRRQRRQEEEQRRRCQSSCSSPIAEQEPGLEHECGRSSRSKCAVLAHSSPAFERPAGLEQSESLKVARGTDSTRLNARAELDIDSGRGGGGGNMKAKRTKKLPIPFVGSSIIVGAIAALPAIGSGSQMKVKDVTDKEIAVNDDDDDEEEDADRQKVTMRKSDKIPVMSRNSSNNSSSGTRESNQTPLNHLDNNHNHHHHHQFSSNDTTQGGEPQMIRYLGSSMQVRSEQKATKVLGVVFFTFAICWTPFFVFNISSAFIDRDQLDKWSEMMTTFQWLGYISSTINPVIYTVFNRNFRRAFRQILLCQPANHQFANRSMRNSEMNRLMRFSQYGGGQQRNGQPITDQRANGGFNSSMYRANNTAGGHRATIRRNVDYSRHPAKAGAGGTASNKPGVAHQSSSSTASSSGATPATNAAGTSANGSGSGLSSSNTAGCNDVPRIDPSPRENCGINPKADEGNSGAQKIHIGSTGGAPMPAYERRLPVSRDINQSGANLLAVFRNSSGLIQAFTNFSPKPNDKTVDCDSRKQSGDVQVICG